MASLPPPKPIAKQLKEHLLEQQEPFTLNIFLSERGYLVKCMSSNGRNGCCQTNNLFKNLNKKMMLLSTRFVKSIDSMLYKLVSANVDDEGDDDQELSCCSDIKDNRDELQTAETPYGFGIVTSPLGASPSCIVEQEYLASKNQPGSLSQTCQTLNLGDEEHMKALTDKTCQTICAQDKYLNLMSMLNKLSSDRVHHIITRQEIPSSRNSTLIENGKGGSFFIFTPFPWKLLAKSVMERYTLIGFKEGKGVIGPYSSSPHFETNYELVNQREEKSIKNDDKKASETNTTTFTGSLLWKRWET